MLRLKPIAAMLACAGFVGFTADQLGADDERYFDPALTPGGLCRPLGDASRNVLQTFRLAAAKTELGPFGGRQADASDPARPRLWNDLGDLHYPIATTNPLAQQYFDQGLKLVYAFNHTEALRAFQEAQRLDADCAMCYWGEALAFGPNINAPMDAAAIAPALAAIGKAQELTAANQGNSKERALIAALAARYDLSIERAKLDAAYADAMVELSAKYLDDADIAVLAAEALMNLSPWDYWEAAGARPKGRTAETIALLERVLAGRPNHPGAIHYYIHLVEASTNPKRAEPHAERLGALMPGAGHLVHMPSHIYFRVGRYLDSLTANIAAVAADEKYVAAAEASSIYRNGYYPHNVHMLMISAQMAGDGKTAIAAAEKLSAVLTIEGARSVPWAQPIKAAPYFTHAQYSDPQTVLALADPGDALPFVKAIWHYARGTAFAARKDFAEARAEADAIAKLKQAPDVAELANVGVPAALVLGVAEQVVLARIAQSQGDLKRAAELFGQAVVLEDQLPYSEPPLWYYPVRQSLGAVLVLLEDYEGAEAAFRASLARAPNNGWALFGLQQVYERKGDDAAAAGVKKLLEQAWAGNRSLLDLARL